MKSRTIKLIILFSAIALVGLVVTQAFWIKQAIGLSEKHFEQRAYSALHGAVQEIVNLKKDCGTNVCGGASHAKIILSLAQPHILDSLLRKHIKYNKIENAFEFAIIQSRNDSIIFQTAGFYKNCPTEKVFRSCLGCLYSKESFHVELIFPDISKSLMGDIWKWLFLSAIFLLIIIFCFGFIIFAVFRHKKLSEMKTDFINNITHEFKTPISTISLASEILVNVKSEIHLEKVNRYAKIIQEENRRMQTQVEQVLRMSRLDKNEYEINKEETDVHELLHNAIHNLCLDLGDKVVAVKYKLEANKSNIMVDPIHLTNIIKNLVENACKYSNGNPQIEVSTSNVPEGVVISVEDNGIGISPDKQKHIFDKFYRVPTGNVHDVKGSGIGLYYVKVMVEAHDGKVKVKSEPGKGSRFDVFLPFQ
jgi:two-component system, OmpR family, phosphate regulon sensor histidine kinase PhoR